MSLSQAGAEGECLANVLLFQIGEIEEQLLDRPAGSKRFPRSCQLSHAYPEYKAYGSLADVDAARNCSRTSGRVRRGPVLRSPADARPEGRFSVLTLSETIGDTTGLLVPNRRLGPVLFFLREWKSFSCHSLRRATRKSTAR